MIVVVPINYEIPLDYLMFPLLVFLIIILVVVIMKIKIFIEKRKDKKNDK